MRPHSRRYMGPRRIAGIYSSLLCTREPARDVCSRTFGRRQTYLLLVLSRVACDPTLYSTRSAGPSRVIGTHGGHSCTREVPWDICSWTFGRRETYLLLVSSRVAYDLQKLVAHLYILHGVETQALRGYNKRNMHSRGRLGCLFMGFRRT